MTVIILVHPLQHSSGFDLLALGHRIAIDFLEHELPQVVQGFLHRRRKADIPCLPGGGDGIAHQRVDPLGMAAAQHPGNGLGNIARLQNACPDGIINIVIDIGIAVCPADNPSLQGLRDPRPCMPQDAHADFIGKIQPLTAIFQDVHHPEALLIMAEGLTHGFGQRHFTGMAEGGMAQVVAHGDGFCQILVELQALGDGAGNAADLDGVSHAGAVMVALRT